MCDTRTMKLSFLKPNRSTLVALSAGLFVAGCAPAEQIKAATAAPAATSSASQDLPRVTTVAAARKAIAQKTEQPGRIEAFLSAPLFPRTTGYVQEVLV